jgi:hypothetical protein
MGASSVYVFLIQDDSFPDFRTRSGTCSIERKKTDVEKGEEDGK